VAALPTPSRHPDELLADLDPSQREAVTTDAAPLAILAGAGAGKTRVLTRRIAWRARTERIEAAHVLAVTFTRKAAGELKSRLAALGVGTGVAAGTIHSIALAQVRRHAAELGRTPPVVLDRKARILMPLIGGRGAAARVAAGELASEIEWAKARLVTPEQYVAAVTRSPRAPSRPASEIADLYARYEREKRSRGLVDFDDLLWMCAETLEQDTAFAASQRWRFRHLFVDEFQDVSPAQLRLLQRWLGDRTDLCVVGDPDQAIYAFAGAEAGILTSFGQRFRGGYVVRLDRNYRSTPQIVGAAEALLADAGPSRPRRHAVRGAGSTPTVTAYESEDAEAASIAARLREVQATGIAWSEMAVLYRTNAQSAAFEEALSRAAIPLRVRGDGRFLERPEVRAALDTLRRSVAAAPGRPFSDALTDLESDAEAGGTSDEQRTHVHAVARLGREYADTEGGTGSIDGFLDFLTASLKGETPETGGDVVELLTFHRAKGLEFHTVFVTGLERGLVPISHADTPPERAEERRLLYVALTRAEHTLHLSYAKQRTLGQRAVNRARSPWLAPIEEALGLVAPGPTPAARAKAGLAEARDRLAAARPLDPDADDADPALLDALVEWRRALARASGVPAYVIFHDTTLRAVASSKPGDRDALLDLPGIGPVKVERHGDAVLDLVRRHAS